MAINEDIFIKEKLIDLNIDGNEGTAMYDLVVSPLAQILEKFKNDNNLNISKFSRFSEPDLIDSDVDFIGNQYLLTRNPGSRASGFVKFYFTSRVSVNITKDSVITNNNKRFKVVNNYSFPASSLNYGPPYYYTNDIQIEALTASEDYNLAKNSPFKIEGYVSNSPAKILNTTELFGGIKSETNSQYLTRIKNSIFGSFLSSPITIENTLKSSFPSIQSVDIISNEHPLMLRDIIYDLSVTSAYNKEDFSFVNTATPNLGYDKMHRAYYGEFKDTNTGAGVGFPTSPSAWSTQFSNSDYKNISLNSDILYKSTSRVSILNGFLAINNYSDTTSLINNGWVLKDGTSIDSELIRPTDITLLSGNLILGKSLYTERTFNVQVGVFDSLLDHIATLGSVPEIQELVTKTKLELTASNANNSSPVALKQIDQHKGIVIKVTMNTNDPSEIGSSSYVTVLKNNLVYSPYDGYGIAWRKQPAYLIRMQRNTYGSDITQKNADLATFENETGRTDGVDFLGNLTGLTAHANATDVLKYNFYVVDNNILEDEVWVSSNQMWDQASGRNQFLAASKVWIEDGVDYNLEMEIGENLGVKAWINKTINPSPIITFGPNAPAYVPNAASNITVGSDTAQRTNFGIGVMNTHNGEWKYRDLTIESIINTFPAHLFKLDVSNFTLTNGATVNYNGIGFDPVQSQTAAGHSALNFAVYNVVTNLWEIIATSNAEPPAQVPYVYANHLMTYNFTSLTNYVDGSNYINFAAIAANENDPDHELTSYYIDITDSTYTGVHKGNAQDIYVYDPSNIGINESEFIVASGKIDFTDNSLATPYITEILSIVDAYSGINILESEWSVTNSIRDRGLEYSLHNKFKISFSSNTYDGAKLRVRYRYLTNGQALNLLLNDDNNRQPAVDSIIKTSPLAVVDIQSLDYSGDVNLINMKSLIKSYINSLNSSRFEKSDLVNFMYSNGATFVDLNMIIEIHLYDLFMNKTIIPLTAQYYDIPVTSIAKFYTSDESMIGVNKL